MGFITRIFYRQSGAQMPVSQKEERYWEKGVGWKTIYRMTGTERAINGLIPRMEETFDRIRIFPDDNSPLIHLEASANDSGDNDAANVAEETWELFGGQEMISLLQSTISKGWLSPVDRTVLRNDMSNLTMPTPERYHTSEAAIAASDLYDMNNLGIPGQITFNPVLRHTRTVANTYSVAQALTNVGSVIAPAKIQSLEGIPADVQFVLPGARADDTELMRSGWFKMYPTAVRTSFNRWNRVQEWHFGQWPIVTHAGSPVSGLYEYIS